MFKRPPDFVIGNPDDPYLRRWWLIPRNRLFNVYLHHIRKSDDDRALHDHPWASLSLMLKGVLREHYCDRRGDFGCRFLRRWRWTYRSPTFAHRLEVIDEIGAWTLFLTGPRVREWGFWCKEQWVHWKTFVSPVNKGEIGRGCGEID